MPEKVYQKINSSKFAKEVNAVIAAREKQRRKKNQWISNEGKKKSANIQAACLLKQKIGSDSQIIAKPLSIAQMGADCLHYENNCSVINSIQTKRN